ncbi:MAG: hypothetical protein KF770_25635 [Anaerolineae bacterium]|nr:hypothetical protein [Anaerolineae bacterium]
MLTALYIVFVALFAWLTWQSWEVYKSKRISYALLLLIVLAGLTYDVLVILLGRFLGEGDLLKALNAGRFVIHGLATPFMIIFGFGVLRHAGVGWAQSRTNHILVCIFATLLIGLGVYEDILTIDLQLRPMMDTLRYVNEGGVPGPPIPALLTIFFLIGAGISLWRHTGWKWLAFGSILMFIFAGAGIGDRFYVGNIGEIIFSAANVWTARKFLT